MEASIVGSAVGGVVGPVVQVGIQSLLTYTQESIKKAKSYNKCLTQLSNSLEMVQQFLSDAETRNKVGLQVWLKQLADVALEAEAVLDKVMYEILRKQVRKQNGGKVTDVFSFGFRKYIFRLRMVGKITDVISKLKKINDDANGLGLPTRLAVAGSVTPIAQETDSFSDEPVVEGRANDVSEIVDNLILGMNGVDKTAVPLSQDKVFVLPICGMGGVGKTTLARTVFNDEKIKKHFGTKRIWVSVPTDFDALSLFKKILEKLAKREVNVTGKDVALENIQELLSKHDEKDKPYLLILDDVWKINNWDEFMEPLPTVSNINGNCIVVTTRIKKVASHVETLTTHKLLCLSERQCWSILKRKAFGEVNVPQEFKGIGKDVAKKCGGLPLAAKIMGGLLRKKPEEYWRNTLENNLFDDDIMKILRLSYDSLPTPSLKRCFAYCSVFPQDYIIRRQEMVELWMAEGFLQSKHDADLEMAGSEVFDSLLQYSLFQDANKDNFGHIVNCKMHDLVHDLTCSITKDMHLALKSAEKNESNDISQMKYLRTMFFKGIIANDMFSNFSCLHVLKLESREIRELPSEIEKLIHLRCLHLLSTKVTCLPESIGKLYHLQTLSIGHHVKLPNTITNLLRGDDVKLPNTITNLLSLRHLNFSDIELPPWIGKLTSLRTLQNYVVRDGNGYSIRELGRLKNLKGQLAIRGLEMVKDKEEAELADLYRKPDIFKLSLNWDKSSDDERHHENVLDGLQPYPRLKYLSIDRYGSKSLPLWAMKMAARKNIGGHWEAFNSLVEIRLCDFAQCEELPMFGHLQRLRILALSKLPRVRFIGHDNLSNPNIAFRTLERLEMSHMPELTKWADVKDATVFPCLKMLRIKSCPKLKTVHCQFPCLEVFRVEDADFSLTNLFSNTISLRDIHIRSLSGLDYFPDDFFVKNQNLTSLIISRCHNLMRLVPISQGGGASLKRLELWECTNLKEVLFDLNTLCNLEYFEIINCPIELLKCIPYDVSGQSQRAITSLRKLYITSLRKLYITNCKGLTDIPIELLESCTSSLVELCLCDLENLENLDSLIPCLQRMQRLRHLDILDVPKFPIVPTEIGCLRSLGWLRIGGFSEPMKVDQITIILSKCPALESLGLRCTEQHFGSLHNLIKQRFQHLNIYILL